MQLTIKKLLEKGYFPKELPPPFHTNSFALKYPYIKKEFDKLLNSGNKIPKSSECVRYSIPKVGLARKNLAIPGPLHYSILCQVIVDHWNEIGRYPKN